VIRQIHIAPGSLGTLAALSISLAVSACSAAPRSGGTHAGARDAGPEPAADGAADRPPDGASCAPGEWLCYGDLRYQCADDGRSRLNETRCSGRCNAELGCIEEASGCQRLDILFVVDISASMRDERDNLAANFPEFVRVLDEFVARDDTAAGYRVGVTNSSINGVYDGPCETTMGLDGSLFRGVDACVLPGDPWIAGPGTGVAETFACLGDNPIAGAGMSGSHSDCGKEMPLEVIQRFGARLAPGGDNEGFYRRDDQSLLAIVLLTDEDEDAASAATPESAKAYLDALTGGEDRYVVVTVAGPGPGDCESAFGEADEATILRDFTSRVPNSVFGDICAGDLTTSLAQALEELTVACEELPELI